MLMIRFQRVGRTNDPSFRIVLTEKRSRPKSSGIELLGSFHAKTKATRLHTARILYWMAHGAQCSARVHNLLVRNKAVSGPKRNVAKKAVSSTVQSKEEHAAE